MKKDFSILQVFKQEWRIKMQIKEMFAKPIDREIQGVIIVGQGEEAGVLQELEDLFQDTGQGWSQAIQEQAEQS